MNALVMEKKKKKNPVWILMFYVHFWSFSWHYIYNYYKPFIWILQLQLPLLNIIIQMSKNITVSTRIDGNSFNDFNKYRLH